MSEKMSAHILVLKTVLVVKAEIDGSLLLCVCVCCASMTEITDTFRLTHCLWLDM